MSFWNYRVFRTTDHDGRIVDKGQPLFFVAETYYDKIDGVDRPSGRTGAISIDAETHDELGTKLDQMKGAWTKPVLEDNEDYLAEHGYFPEVSREPVQASEEPAGAAEPGGSADPGGEPDLRQAPGDRSSRSPARGDLGTVHRADHQEGE